MVANHTRQTNGTMIATRRTGNSRSATLCTCITQPQKQMCLLNFDDHGLVLG